MYIYDFFDLDILMVHGSFDIAPLQEAITNLTLFNFKRHLVLCTKVASTWPDVVLKLSFKREAGEMRWLCIRKREREREYVHSHTSRRRSPQHGHGISSPQCCLR